MRLTSALNRAAASLDTVRGAFHALDGWNPQSPTLFGPKEASGNCLRDEKLYLDKLTWCDFSAPIRSGDVVSVFWAEGDFSQVFGKRIERTRDGRLWLVSWLTDDESSLTAIPLDYMPFCENIVAIAPIVATLEIPRRGPRSPVPEEMPSANVVHTLAQLSAPALSEWRHLGFPPRESLAISNDIETAAQLCASHRRVRARNGWVNRTFRCIERDPQRNEEGGEVIWITAKAVAASVYTDLVTADYTTGTAATNSTQSEAPDAPTGLTATSMRGAIIFSWALGEFWTLNGVVELWEYTANTPFSSATKIWEGRGTSVVIQKNDFITRYYWIRLRTIGDQTSATEPATNGLAGVALDRGEIIVDPRFEFAADQTWWNLQANFLSGGTPTNISISATGGVSGGYLQLTGDSTDKFALAKRSPPPRATTGQTFRCHVRWMRTGTLTSALGTDVVFSAAVYDSLDGAQPPSAVNGGGFLQLDRATVNAVTVNQWQESTFTYTMVNVAKSSPQYPYAQAALAMYAQCTGGTIRVDSFDIYPI